MGLLLGYFFVLTRNRSLLEMSLASNFGFIGEWCGVGEYGGVLNGRAPSFYLGSKQDDFAEFAVAPDRFKDVGIPYAAPANNASESHVIGALSGFASSFNLPCMISTIGEDLAHEQRHSIPFPTGRL